MFRNVPDCSGMFHDPDFIDGQNAVLKSLAKLLMMASAIRVFTRLYSYQLTIKISQ